MGITSSHPLKKFDALAALPRKMLKTINVWSRQDHILPSSRFRIAAQDVEEKRVGSASKADLQPFLAQLPRRLLEIKSFWLLASSS